MKIAILVHSFPPCWVGGTEIATYNIAKRLGELGNEVHVITELDDVLDSDEGFSIHRFPLKRVKILGYIYFWLRILPFLKKLDPDVIHCQGIVMGIPVFFKWWYHKPVIVYHRDNILDQSMEKYFSKPVLKRADTVIALTDYMKKRMLSVEEREILVINNGIDLDEFPPYSRKQVREKLGWDLEDVILINVGRLEKIKGTDYLIDAMRILKENKIQVKLIIVGDGKLKKDLEREVKKQQLNIEFMGNNIHERALEYLLASDIFILPSLSEGFPNVCLEAMAAGLSIVTTDIGGMSEIVDGNGFLVKPENPEEIARAVQKLVEDQDLREELGKKGKLKVKNYEFKRIVREIEEVYEDLVG